MGAGRDALHESVGLHSQPHRDSARRAAAERGGHLAVPPGDHEASEKVFARGFVNAWGHAFDDYGVSFATDGASGEGINYVVRGVGGEGTEPGHFDLPHGIVLDSRDCLYVADTMNTRIQKFAVG